MYVRTYLQGEFQDGIMHGMGKFSWTDGLVYEVLYIVCIYIIYDLEGSI